MSSYLVVGSSNNDVFDSTKGIKWTKGCIFCCTKGIYWGILWDDCIANCETVGGELIAEKFVKSKELPDFNYCYLPILTSRIIFLAYAVSSISMICSNPISRGSSWNTSSFSTELTQ